MRPEIGIRPHPVDTRAVAEVWADQLFGTSHVGMWRSELRHYLVPLTEQLVAEIHAAKPDPKVATLIGQKLVADHFTTPTSLGKSVELIVERFEELCGCVEHDCQPAAQRRRRLTRLLAALTVGYSAALRDRVLAEQADIHQAVAAIQARAATALQVSEARFRTVVAEAATGIAIMTMNGRLVECNPALERMFGYEHGSMCGPVEEFVADSAREGTRHVLAELATGARTHAKGELPCHVRDGGKIWIDVTLSLIGEADVTHVACLVTDVTERRLAQQRLRYQADYDPLTQLPNRALLLRRLTGLLDKASEHTRLGLCYFDLDWFKEVNDTFGHAAGDTVLVEIAHRLTQRLAAPRHLAARIGGDEFVVLVENPESTADLVSVAEIILAAVADPIRLGDRLVHLTSSVGIVERTTEHHSAQELLAAADTALYWAKRQGKGQWALFDTDMRLRRDRVTTVALDLREAIHSDTLVLHYQPIVELSTRRITGVEVLVRWPHPTLGMLAPREFLEIAEATNLATTLDRWVLTSACRQFARWEDFLGSGARLHVNISLGQLLTADLDDVVSRDLTETGLPATSLCLEIQEHTAFRDVIRGRATLNRLRESGIQLAIDDFGVGYSSLARLKALPVSTIKIDRGFVHDLATNPEDVAIVKSIIELASSFGLDVIAEGVEDATAASVLADLGCRRAQGYLFGKPATAETFEQMLRATTPSGASATRERGGAGRL